MLLGIVLHAAIAYMVVPMQGLLWALREQPTHVGFDLLFWWIHAWRIPLFFVLAGFFAAMLARRRGAKGFIKHRFDRILKPVLIAMVTVLPLTYVFWSWGWMTEHRVFWEEVWQFDFRDPGIENHFMGPGHLWFLNYLMIFSVLYWALLRWRRVLPDDPEPGLGRLGKACFTSGFRPIVFAIPTAAFLWMDPGFYLAYHHVIPMSLGQVVYEAAQLAYQGYFFVVGVYLFRLHREIAPMKRYAWVYLLLAQAVFVVICIMHTGWLDDSYGDEHHPAFGVGLAVSVALFCWLMIWGLIAIGLTVLDKPRPVVRWLSDSAYWVYLVHLPLVGLLMVTAADWPVSPWIKFFLIVSVTSVLTLYSYQWFVRYTFIGRMLNGPRNRPSQNG